MSLTVPYTIELIRRIDREVPGSVKWVEETLPPDDYDGYAQASPTHIGGGGGSYSLPYSPPLLPPHLRSRLPSATACS